ncbi:hypothetical protein RF11_14474 [Thelohanellus kitauei]|uniref:Uncharacterized protein n=1 Tax=Thelohanellus kitauei TaxID=669202 RepID=A0A0C2N1D1_THEKT|nr:hypothetical protein RF11_14474 [Thelohanellus kitauei]
MLATEDSTEYMKDDHLTPTLTSSAKSHRLHGNSNDEMFRESKDRCLSWRTSSNTVVNVYTPIRISRNSCKSTLNKPKTMRFKIFFEKFKNLNSLTTLTKGTYPGCSSRIHKEIARCLDPKTVFKNIFDCRPETIVGIALHQNENVNIDYLQGLCYVAEFKNLLSDLLRKAQGYQTRLMNVTNGQQLQDSLLIKHMSDDVAKNELSFIIQEYRQMITNQYLDNVNELITQVILAKFGTENEINREVTKYIINSMKEIVMSETSIKTHDEHGKNFIFVESNIDYQF